MTIASIADYRAAVKQTISFVKTDTNASSSWISAWYHPGFPAAGAAVANTTTGVVPTNATSGAAAIMPFGGTGYLTRVEASVNVVPARIMVVDRLWHGGSFNCVNTTSTFNLTAPSYTSRLPTVGGSPDYNGLFIGVEMKGLTGTSTFQITYTNESGTAGQTNGAFSPGGAVTGVQLVPLVAGDRGVQKIDSVILTNSGGSPNGYQIDVFVYRPLFIGRVPIINRQAVEWSLDQTKMPIVFSDSCLTFLHRGDTNTNATCWVDLEIAAL